MWEAWETLYFVRDTLFVFHILSDRTFELKCYFEYIIHIKVYIGKTDKDIVIMGNQFATTDQ